MSKYFDLDFPSRAYIANKTVQWHNSDKPENYVSKGNLYKPESFGYTFNSQGFRCDEFTNEPSLVFIGCSITEGIGLPLEQCWAHRVASELNVPYINIGMGGAGYDAMSRALYLMQDKIKPKVAIILLPGVWRRELIEVGEYVFWSPVQQFNFTKNKNQVLMNEDWVMYQSMKNLVMMDMIFRRFGTTVIWDSWYKRGEDIVSYLEFDKLKTFQHRVESSFSKYVYGNDVWKARDGIHPGPDENKEYADGLLDQYGELIRSKLKE